MEAGDEATPTTRPESSFARAWTLYTLLRMLVFVGAAGFLLLFGFNGLPLLICALIVSMVVSVFALRPQRAALVAAMAARQQRRAAERESLRSRLDEA
ncbi:MAG: DUF4229 domain-containing protein [Frankiaceae bacterium]|nr:DUF4229 domain-containing protein [Frankiaceae bacterium]